MTERYDALERLQRLRESGALTDQEFEAEKRRLLDGAPLAAPEAPRRDRRRIAIYAGSALAGVAVAAGIGVWVGRDARGGSDSVEATNRAALPDIVAEENLIQTPTLPDVLTLPAPEQVTRAFEAAFGQRGAAIAEIEGERVRFEPRRLLWTPSRAVLISEGSAPDAAHASPGHLAIHYLRPSADRFEVARSFVPAVSAGSSGNLGEWTVSGRFGERPVISVAGGGTWQGYTCSILTLTELGPTGPIVLAKIPLVYSDEGAQENEADATRIEGRIANVVKGRSFDIAYSGSDSFVERYVRSGNRYVREAGGQTRMRTC
ncbi:MAG TPA: SHOCT domain-containing protein [Allosphingosinicella sp.]